MKKLLIIALLFVGCDESGITSNGLTDGTAVTDTLYIFNYDTLIVTNYDTTIVNNYDTLIITNYDTLIINQVCDGDATIDDCGLCTGGSTGLEINYLKDCNNVCGGGAIIDNCGVCSGGTTGLEVNYLKDECGVCEGDNSTCRDCMGIPNGIAVLDNCGQCWYPNTNLYAECDIKIDVQLDIEPLNIFSYSDWIDGNVTLASLSLTNNTASSQNIYISYYGSLNNTIVVEGRMKGFEISSGNKVTISNSNIDLHNIIKYEENLPALSLSTLGDLISGNYNITIYAKQAYGNHNIITEAINDGTILGYYSLDSLYQTP